MGNCFCLGTRKIVLLYLLNYYLMSHRDCRGAVEPLRGVHFRHETNSLFHTHENADIIPSSVPSDVNARVMR